MANGNQQNWWEGEAFQASMSDLPSTPVGGIQSTAPQVQWPQKSDLRWADLKDELVYVGQKVYEGEDPLNIIPAGMMPNEKFQQDYLQLLEAFKQNPDMWKAYQADQVAPPAEVSPTAGQSPSGPFSSADFLSNPNAFDTGGTWTSPETYAMPTDGEVPVNSVGQLDMAQMIKRGRPDDLRALGIPSIGANPNPPTWATPIIEQIMALPNISDPAEVGVGRRLRSPHDPRFTIGGRTVAQRMATFMPEAKENFGHIASNILPGLWALATSPAQTLAADAQGRYQLQMRAAMAKQSGDTELAVMYEQLSNIPLLGGWGALNADALQQGRAGAVAADFAMAGLVDGVIRVAGAGARRGIQALPDRVDVIPPRHGDLLRRAGQEGVDINVPQALTYDVVPGETRSLSGGQLYVPVGVAKTLARTQDYVSHGIWGAIPAEAAAQKAANQVLQMRRRTQDAFATPSEQGIVYDIERLVGDMPGEQALQAVDKLPEGYGVEMALETLQGDIVIQAMQPIVEAAGTGFKLLDGQTAPPMSNIAIGQMVLENLDEARLVRLQGLDDSLQNVVFEAYPKPSLLERAHPRIVEEGMDDILPRDRFGTTIETPMGAMETGQEAVLQGFRQRLKELKGEIDPTYEAFRALETDPKLFKKHAQTVEVSRRTPPSRDIKNPLIDRTTGKKSLTFTTHKEQIALPINIESLQTALIREMEQGAYGGRRLGVDYHGKSADPAKFDLTPEGPSIWDENYATHGERLASAPLGSPMQKVVDLMERVINGPDVYSAVGLETLVRELKYLRRKHEVSQAFPGLTDETGGALGKIIKDLDLKVIESLEKVSIGKGKNKKNLGLALLEARKKTIERWDIIDFTNKLPEEPFQVIADIASGDKSLLRTRKILKEVDEARPAVASAVQEYFMQNPTKWKELMGGRTAGQQEVRALLYPNKTYLRQLDDQMALWAEVDQLATEPVKVAEYLRLPEGRSSRIGQAIAEVNPDVMPILGRNIIEEGLRKNSLTAIEKGGAVSNVMNSTAFQPWLELDLGTRAQMVGTPAAAASLDLAIRNLNRYHFANTSDTLRKALTRPKQTHNQFVKNISEELSLENPLHTVGRQIIEELDADIFAKPDAPVFTKTMQNQWKALTPDQKTALFGAETAAELDLIYARMAQMKDMPSSISQAVRGLGSKEPAKALNDITAIQKLTGEKWLEVRPRLQRMVMDEVLELNNRRPTPRDVKGATETWNKFTQNKSVMEKLGFSKEHIKNLNELFEIEKRAIIGSADEMGKILFAMELAVSVFGPAMFVGNTLVDVAVGLMTGVGTSWPAVMSGVGKLGVAMGTITGGKWATSALLNSPRFVKTLTEGIKLPKMPASTMTYILETIARGGAFNRDELPPDTPQSIKDWMGELYQDVREIAQKEEGF